MVAAYSKLFECFCSRLYWVSQSGYKEVDICSVSACFFLGLFLCVRNDRYFRLYQCILFIRTSTVVAEARVSMVMYLENFGHKIFLTKMAYFFRTGKYIHVWIGSRIPGRFKVFIPHRCFLKKRYKCIYGCPLCIHTQSSHQGMLQRHWALFYSLTTNYLHWIQSATSDGWTRNPEVPSSSPLFAGHAGVLNPSGQSWPTSWGFFQFFWKPL